MAASSAKSSSVSSFQKKGRVKLIEIPGTRPSIHNGQLLVSTGVPSLDLIIGGGVAVGTVLLVEEDLHRNYSDLLLKYFLAEGVMAGHQLLVASADIHPNHLLQNLPGPVDVDISSRDEQAPLKDEKMKIAWRYQKNSPVQQQTTNRFGHYYDLTKVMTSEFISSRQSSQFYVPEVAGLDFNSSNERCYDRLLAFTHEIVKREGFDSLQNPHRNVLRLAFRSLGSPMWGETGGVLPHTGADDPALPRFLYTLRALLRSSLCTALITVPTNLFQDLSFTRRLETLCDTAIHLEAFVDSQKYKNPAYKEYHGMFTIKKLPSLNSLKSQAPDSFDLAFKLRRKKLTIEKFHLPPDLSDTASRTQEDPLKGARAPSIGCGAIGGSRGELDF